MVAMVEMEKEIRHILGTNRTDVNTLSTHYI